MEKTLLIVDDEENIVRALSRLLRRDGYRIYTASGGEDGLRVLAQHPVHVVVSDQRMPGMSGSEFLKEVKRTYPETIRIILSGYAEIGTVTAALNDGAAYKFLVKPWDDQELRAYIQDAFMAHTERFFAESKPSASPACPSPATGVETGAVWNPVAILQMLPLGVVVLDSRGTFAFANGEAVRLIPVLGGVPAGADLARVAPELSSAYRALRSSTLFKEVKTSGVTAQLLAPGAESEYDVLLIR